MPLPDLFISYSRQCIGFVDELAHKLQREGFNVWLDYLRLIPGRPWEEQIYRGLDEAEVLLLVVSPESMSSKSVEIEWRHFLQHQKRIILLIFQAVPLPPELADLEWVDFRGAYAPAVKRLLKQIREPGPAERPAPQSGFRAPFTVWFAFGLSIITAIYSLFAFWTILIPWALLPLPGRILKRNFTLSHVQTALWTLTIALFFSFGLSIELGIFNENADFDYNNMLSFYNIALLALFLQIYFIPLISILLLITLHTPAMQRWGRPEASVPKFANIHHPNILKPEPVHYYIEHAPEDLLIARDLAAELVKYGHTPAVDIPSANEVLVLLSRFKTDSEADPEKQIVYPILVQRTRISEKLSRMQWIDFRKGVRNLEAIAKLLPQPAKMLAAIGVRPTTGAQAAMPNIALALMDYLLIMGMVDLGSFISYFLELFKFGLAAVFAAEPGRVTWILTQHFIFMALSGAVIYFMVRALTERRGRFASPGVFLLGIVGIAVLFIWQFSLGDAMTVLFAEHGIVLETMFAILPFLFLMVGGLIVGLMALIRIRALRRWFPAKGK